MLDEDSVTAEEKVRFQSFLQKQNQGKDECLFIRCV